jgi:2-phosphosulfolactate phosphatase
VGVNIPLMRLNVVLLPRDATAESFAGRAVAVFDVLRATTTMTAALAAGVREIRIFGDTEEARQAAAAAGNPTPLLCGEVKCLPPAGFDLGNSPGALNAAAHEGRTLFMSTTNGTRAIIAARSAKLLLAGAVVNASAVARALAASGLDATLPCAGTNGEIAMEDVIGAGAVIDAAQQLGEVEFESDAARMAVRLFRAAKDDLRNALAVGAGGRNVIAAKLEADIDFAARLNVIDVVGRVHDVPLRLVRH